MFLTASGTLAMETVMLHFGFWKIGCGINTAVVVVVVVIVGALEASESSLILTAPM